MAGFTNDILNAENVNFSGIDPTVGEVDTDGQLLIGSATAPFLRPNTLSMQDGLSTINAAGSITITPRGAGTGNMFLGQGAGNISLSGTTNDGYGFNCLSSVTSGSSNVGMGVFSLNGIQDGNNNVSLGALNLRTATSASNNVSIGYSCMDAAGNVVNNVCIGYFNSTSITGDTNTYVGGAIAQVSSGGSGNAGLGFSALHLNSGMNNSAIGSNSLGALLTGNFNVSLGNNSGINYTSSESSNITINRPGNVGDTGESNTLRIGNGTGTGNQELERSFISGIFGTTVAGSGIPIVIDANDQLGTVVSSRKFKENIQTMTDESSSIFDLNPVCFNYIADSKKNIQYGLIAEEVNEINERLVVRDKDGEIHSVKYNDLPILLLNEMKKMKKEISDLKYQLLKSS